MVGVLSTANVLEKSESSLRDFAVHIGSRVVDEPAGVVRLGKEVLVESEVRGEEANDLVVEESLRDGSVLDEGSQESSVEVGAVFE